MACGGAVVLLSIFLLLNRAAAQLDVCGRAPRNTRIVGGQVAPEGAWPWMVSVHRGGRHICGGSLVNNQWVLSAAHCFQSGTARDNTVYVGRQSQELANPNEQRRTIVELINHPDYNSGTNDNDMALLKMETTVGFTDYIRPVCLAAPGSSFHKGLSSWIMGWGDIASGSNLPSPQNMMEVEVPIVGNRQCQCDYDGVFTITGNMVCAGLEEGGKDSCQGDSGGPMVSKQNNRWVQSGVVSFGKGCALPRNYGVYARVSKYQAWIQSHITVNQPGFVTFTSSGTDGDLSVSCSAVPPLTTSAPLTTTAAPVVCGRAPLNSLSKAASGAVSVGQWPWLVSVQKNYSHVCGGSLVTEDAVLSDAGCFSSSVDPTGWSVALGLVSLGSNSSGTRINVSNVTMSNGNGSNIAVLRLSSKPSLSDSIQPICLDMGLSLRDGTTLYSAGWGEQGATGDLKQMNTTIQSCGTNSSSDNICTGAFNLQQGDYGGPLMVKASGSWYVTVVLTNSSSTSRAAGMTFEKVSRFASFLRSTLGTLPSPAAVTTTPQTNTTASPGSAPPVGRPLLYSLLPLPLLLLWG